MGASSGGVRRASDSPTIADSHPRGSSNDCAADFASRSLAAARSLSVKSGVCRREGLNSFRSCPYPMRSSDTGVASNRDTAALPPIAFDGAASRSRDPNMLSAERGSTIGGCSCGTVAAGGWMTGASVSGKSASSENASAPRDGSASLRMPDTCNSGPSEPSPARIPRASRPTTGSSRSASQINRLYRPTQTPPVSIP